MQQAGRRHFAIPFLISAVIAGAACAWHTGSGGWAEAAGSLDAPVASEALPAYSIAVTAPREISVAATAAHPGYTVYTPGGPDVADAAPVTLMVMHGMGGNGPGIAAAILPYARAQGWTVVAPTVPYGEWRDPSLLAGEELGLQPQLANLLDSVPGETGVTISPQVMLFGFSRGAQAALRFALLFPERVQAVAACSAGTYTIPAKSVLSEAGLTIAAPLPYGLADIEQRAGRDIQASAMAGVRFLISVGARDNREADVPRQWDQFLGKTRVERAERFAALLAQFGLPARAVVVPDTGHELSGPMMEQVNAFLSAAAVDAQAQRNAGTTTLPTPPRPLRQGRV